MKTPQQLEVEQLALAAELARQIGHECSNFVYCVILKLELWQATRSPATFDDWLSIQQEAKKLAVCLQDWHDFHGRIEMHEQRIDLPRLVDEAGNELREYHPDLDLAISHADAPLWIMSDFVGITHLLQLITRDLIQGSQGESSPAVSIQTSTTDSAAIVTVSIPKSKNDGAATHEEPSSLLHKACQSLAVRLDAKLIRQHDSEGRYSIQIELPRCPT
jgi:hypothetical protein